MRYVALYNDAIYACWPKQAEEEYLKDHTMEEFENMDGGEQALWLGSWLMKHKDEFGFLPKDDWDFEMQPNTIYQEKGYGKAFGFSWIERDEDCPGTCSVVVEELQDNVLWTVETDSEYDCERVAIFHKPDKNGYLKYMPRYFTA